MRACWRVRVVCALLLTRPVVAAEPVYRFDTTGQQQRFQTLTQSLRCLVCQGESIANSNADLATDMRAKVHELLLAGRSNEAIRGYMTERYGDFVLFRPPFKPTTWLLWLAPGVLGVVALGVALATARRRRRTDRAALTRAERDRLDQDLARHDREQGGPT